MIVNGMIEAVNASVALAGDRTIIVPGHGPVGDRAQLKEFGDMLVAVRDDVAKLKKQGKAAMDVVAAKPTAVYDAKWGQFVIDPAFFTSIVDGL